jgi:hypothetical protein
VQETVEDPGLGIGWVRGHGLMMRPHLGLR